MAQSPLQIVRRTAFETWREWTVNGLLASPVVPRPLRGVLLKAYGFPISGPVTVSQKVWFGSRNVTMGRGVRIGIGSFLNASGGITLEEDVWLGMHCLLLTAGHDIGDEDRRGGPLNPKPITVRRGSWLGARVTVMPGVTIAPGCVIAAGALVTKDTEPNGLYAGVPAKRLRDLPTKADRAAAATSAPEVSAPEVSAPAGS